MRPVLPVAVLLGFAVLLGCAPSKSSDASDGGDPPRPLPEESVESSPVAGAGDPPKPSSKEDPAAVEAQLAAPKEKGYTTGKDLLADMPKESAPKLGDAAAIERSHARKWLEKNVVGRTVERKITVTKVAVGGNDPYTVWLNYDGGAQYRIPDEARGFQIYYGLTFGEQFPIGGESCRVYVCWDGTTDDIPKSVILRSCTEAEVRQLQEWEKREVTLRATIHDVFVGYRSAQFVGENGMLQYDTDRANEIPILMVVSQPSVNGFVPAASLPQ